MEKKFVQPQFNLRRVMIRKNVNDNDLALLGGISRTSINRIINGHSSPSLERLFQIADVLEVSFFDLFD